MVTTVDASASLPTSNAVKTFVEDKFGKQLTNENLNNITTPGLYYAGGGNTVTNKPTNVDAFGLKVFRTASGYITQELIEGNTTPGTR